jgi:hypothetical protein
MSNSSEAQRIAAVRKLTSELYVLQDRMNQTIDQITGLLHGSELSSLVPIPLPPDRTPDGALEHSMSPTALALPLPQVYVNNPPSGSPVGQEAKLFSDYKNGQLQLVQVPASRGSDARFAIVLNYANFDATYLSLVFDARKLLEDLPAGKLRISMALEARSDPQVKLHAKFAFKVGEHWGEHHMAPKGTRVQVDSFEVPMIDPTIVEALDFHLIFTPQTRGCIELHRVTFSVSVTPVAENASANVFEGEA